VIVGASYGTVSDIEIMWVTIAVFGLTFALLNFIDARKDVEALESLPAGGNGRGLVAKSQQWQDGIRMLIHVIFISIGLVAFTLPDPPDTLDKTSGAFIAGVLIRWGLILASSLLVVQSAIARNVRKRVMDQARGKAEDYSHRRSGD
jgi:hypothetical protein